MPFSFKDALIIWKRLLLGRRERSLACSAVVLSMVLFEGEKSKHLGDFELIDEHIFVRSFMYIFLEWFRVHNWPHSLSLFSFIVWLC